MISKTLASTAIVLFVATAAMGCAYGRDGRPDDRGEVRGEGRGDVRGDMKAGPRNGSGQPDYKLDDRDGRGMNGRADERGAGPQHAYRRGDRLPPHAHGDKDVVGDWRAHHLSEPPRGSHWVRTGDDFVLVAITTGVIMELLLNH